MRKAKVKLKKEAADGVLHRIEMYHRNNSMPHLPPDGGQNYTSQ